MDLANHVILIGSTLLLGSILVGLLSARFGAPLLLVFLGLGMVAGEDGPGGLLFEDYQSAYLMGSIALAVILFNGGLRTKTDIFTLALWPSFALASFGVLVTAGVTACAAVFFLDLSWPEAFLLGAIVGSTDAAAVFMLLTGHGLRLPKRVLAALEAESGLNDPMAIFLTTISVSLLLPGAEQPDGVLGWGGLLGLQLLGGALLGWASGRALSWTVNALDLAAGLYPIYVLAWAMTTFAAAQISDASGFLAVYITAMIFGNRRHQAAHIIDRFHDGLSWLCQIGMFLMLGLLVTPSHLMATLWPAIGIAFVLIFMARPLAVFLCLSPFRFSMRQQLFVSWVGLRGAVPIFLGSIPVLAGVPNANLYFSVAFVIVLLSLLVQGWTIAPVAKLLRVEDTSGDAVQDQEAGLLFDMPGSLDQDMIGYAVGKGSLAEGRPVSLLGLPHSVSVAVVVRDGQALAPDRAETLERDDMVLMISPQSLQHDLKTTFMPRISSRSRPSASLLSSFFQRPRAGRSPLPWSHPLVTTAPTWLAKSAMPVLVLGLIALFSGLVLTIWPQSQTLSVDTTEAMIQHFEAAALDIERIAQGQPAPPLFLESLPADWPQDLSLNARKQHFIEAVLPLLLAENKIIRQDRQRLQEIIARQAQGLALTLRQQAQLDLLARHYGLSFHAGAALLDHIDEIPVSLALAQAAIGSGWGQSRLAREENSLFGLASAIAPLREETREKTAATALPQKEGQDKAGPGGAGGGAGGGRAKAPPDHAPDHAMNQGYDSLRASVRAYMRYLNRHSAFKAFRDRRKALRTAGQALTGSALLASLKTYAKDGQYLQNLRLTIKANGLTRLETATLREAVAR